MTKVLTCGGGAQNDTWARIRERVIPGGVKVETARNAEACVGAAMLARRGLREASSVAASAACAEPDCREGLDGPRRHREAEGERRVYTT